MTKLLPTVAAALLALALAGCELSPTALERIHQLELERVRQEALAEQAETPEERLERLQAAEELQREQERVRAEDMGRRAGYAWEIALAALGLGGVGGAATRKLGKSRAEERIHQLEGVVQDLAGQVRAFREGWASSPPVPPPPAPPRKTGPTTNIEIG